MGEHLLRWSAPLQVPRYCFFGDTVNVASVDPRGRTARPPDQALARCGQAGQDALL